MANSVKGEVPLKLSDGRQLTLVANIEATIAAESLYGKPATQIARDAQAGFIGAIRALFWGMLQQNHPEITPGEVAEMLSSNMEEIEVGLSAAVAAAAPKTVQTDGEGRESKDPPKSRRGKSSGSNGAK